MACQRFPKGRRVRRRAEFQQAFEHGFRIHGRFLTLIVAPNRSARPRLGVVASRKLGGAVARNLAKRLIREVFRRNSIPGLQGVDLVVIPRRELFDAAYSSFETDFVNACRRSAVRLGAGRG